MTTSQASTHVSFKTILFATDFSPASEVALPYLLSLARGYKSKVIVAHAVPIEPLAGITPVPSLAEIDLEWKDAQQEMQKYRDSQAFAGLRHEFVLERGNLLEVVSDLIAHESVELVVLGTHGRRGLRKLFAGSIAEQIFRKATCPILTVGPDAEACAPQGWKPRRILFATEFSTGSLHALPYAVSLADENQAELVLLHVVPLVPWEQQAELAGLYQKRLQELVPQDSQHACRMEFAVRFDLAAPGIISMAKDTRPDLIVMGAHPTHLLGIESHVPGATAYEVISNAHCPVLTVRG